MRRSQTAPRRARSLAIATLLILGSVLTAAPTAAALTRPAGVRQAPAGNVPHSGLTGRKVLAHGARSRGSRDLRPARRVVVKDLPASAPRSPIYQPKRLTPTSRTTTAVPRSPASLAVSQIPATVTTTNPATEEVHASGASSGTLEPPDPFVAVGPDHVVQATNAGITVTNRTLTGGATKSLEDFFGITQIPGYQAVAFDPRVIFDAAHNRWIATEASFDCLPQDATDTQPAIIVGTGYIDLAISDTADPTGSWGIVSLAYPDTVPDFPGLGTSTDKVAASANVFALKVDGTADLGCDVDGTAFVGTELDVLSWAQLMGTGNLDVEFLGSYFGSPPAFGATAGEFQTLRPSVQAPSATTAVLGVGVRSSNGAVVWFKITGLPSSVAGTAHVAFANVAAIDPFDGSVPPPNQPGAPTTIVDAVDGRPTDAMWQNDRLVFVSTLSCDPAGGVVEDRDCVRVTEIAVSGSTTNPTVTQDMIISEDGRDLYMGGIGLAQNGDLHVVWTASSVAAGDFPSTYTAYQARGTTANSLTGKQKIAPGTASYGFTRWGDYVGVAQDPRVPDAVWQADEFSSGSSWSTRVSELRTFPGASYVPVTPVRVLDSRGTLGGATGGFSASVPRSFQVTNGTSIPTTAIAVTGNVTIVGQQSAGYLAVTPDPTASPTSSTINFPLGDTRANNFTLPLTSAGKLAAVYKAPAGKKTNVVVDITGYFTAGSTNGTYTTTTPTRILDTRGNVGLTGNFKAGIGRSLTVAKAGGIVPVGATAITGNLTVARQTAAGYLSVTPNLGKPPSSTLNFPVGDVRANGFTGALNGTGALAITYTGPTGTSTDVILDVTGYYTAGPGGLLFYPLSPGRRLDSRVTVLSAYHGKFAGGVPHAISTTGHQGVAVAAQAMTGNLTVVNQTKGGYVADTPTPTATPSTSTINFPVGDTRANGVTVPLSGGSQALVFIGGSGTTDLILDVTGYFK